MSLRILAALALAWPALVVRAQSPEGHSPEHDEGEPSELAGAESSTSLAQPSEHELERARTLFAKGLSFAEQQAWAAAERCFREVLAIRSSPVVSYNLASALVQLGRLREGAELLRGLLQDLHVDAETRGAAQRLLSETEPRIGSVTVRVLGDLRGARLRLDGVAVALSARVLPLSVDPGSHELAIERDGASLDSRQVLIGNEHPLHAEVLFELPPVPEAVLEPAPEPRVAPTVPAHVQAPRDEPGLLSRWWFWGGVTLLAGAATITAVALASGDAPEPLRGDTDPPLVRIRPGSTP